MTRWSIGEASIEELLKAGELQHLVGDAAHGEPWLAKAATTLSSARRLANDDPASAYVLAYDAARQACVGVLAQQGLRPTTSGGHYAVDRAVAAASAEPRTVRREVTLRQTAARLARGAEGFVAFL
jgi:ABC-type xylose transport system substrate-binding protein